MVTPLQNTFITAQRTQVIWMLALQCKFSFGAVPSAGEKRLSAESDVVDTVKYLLTNFCKTRNCVAVCV